MFRRRRTNEEGSKKVSSSPQETERRSLYDGDDALWYKKPSPNNNTTADTPPSTNVPVPYDLQHAQQVMQTHPHSQDPPWAGAPQRTDHHHHHHRPPPPVYATSRNHPGMKPPPSVGNNYTQNHAPHGEPNSMQNRRFSSDVSIPTEQHHTVAIDLFSVILKGDDWNSAMQIIEQDPKCAREKQSVTLQGLKTVAYPLHAAVCLNPPVSFRSLVDCFNFVHSDHFLQFALLSGRRPFLRNSLVRFQLPCKFPMTIPAACLFTGPAYPTLRRRYYRNW
jgi:hypothetical protein